MKMDIEHSISDCSKSNVIISTLMIPKNGIKVNDSTKRSKVFMTKCGQTMCYVEVILTW